MEGWFDMSLHPGLGRRLRFGLLSVAGSFSLG